LADEPGSGGVAHRTPVDLLTGWTGSAPVSVFALALALVAAWLLVDPRTPDLAAQVYRVELYRQLGFVVWDENWYAGHDLPGYSLLFPPLGALLGIRLLGGLSVLASTVLFERLARSVYGDAARWGAAWFAVAALGDVWSGRMTFALGVPLALAAMLALRRGHPAWAGLLAALCAAASPVAGALLGLVGLTVALADRSPRALLVLAGPAAAVVLSLVLLFPEGGYEPYPVLSFGATALVTIAFLWALPPNTRTLRIGGLVYLLACVACLVLHTPVGSNVERYGVLLAGPLLLCSRMAVPERLARPRARAGSTMAAAVALCAAAVWVVWGPVRETLAVAGSEATSASYYEPVERFLSTDVRGLVRVEVPLTRSHWEAALLAPSVSLARGWEKQLDTRFDRVLLTPGLTAAAYDGWLHEQAVAYVALPDVPLDPSSAQEGRLIRGGLRYLRQVFASAHWRIYRVLAPTPLASGPGRLISMAHDSFSLRASSAGSFLVRVHFTRYLTLTRGSGCVERAPGGWTAVSVDGPGTATVAARFSLARALGAGSSCTRGASEVPAAGSGSGTVSGSGAPSPAQSPAASYRWLVRTVGAPPSIGTENRAAGTTAWRLPGPSYLIGGAAHGAVAGYVAEEAIAPGSLQASTRAARRRRGCFPSAERSWWAVPTTAASLPASRFRDRRSTATTPGERRLS
jgi:hypothetical protein